MTALIIVDLQNDFMPGGTLAVKGGDQILSVVNELLTLPFDAIVASKDWHPKRHSSFASNGGPWPDHCVQETHGAEFHPGWDSSKVQAVFLKGQKLDDDSYSVFIDTGLPEYLKKNGIDKVYLTGLTTEYCVKYSALDAKKLGFKVNVVLDGCAGVDLNPQDSKKAIEEMKEAGVRIRFLKEIRGGGI